MNVDTLLRETLASYADRAPGAAGLMEAVRDQSARRRRRHLAAGGTVVAVMAVAVVLAGWALWTGGAAPAPGPVALPSTTVGLVPAQIDLPAVPLRPGWWPEQAGEPVAGLRRGQEITDLVRVGPDRWVGSGRPSAAPAFWVAHYPRGGDESGDQLAVISFGVAPHDVSDLVRMKFADGATEHEDAAEEVTVQGRSAALLTRAGPDGTVDEVAVTWRHRADAWVTVYGGSVGRQDVLRYAESLVDEPLPVLAPFDFRWMPAGAYPGAVGPGWFSFWGATGEDPGYLGVGLRTAYEPGQDGSGEPVEVGGRPAWLRQGELATTLHVVLDADRVLEVTASGSLQLDRDDLLRFAAGVQVNPDAEPLPPGADPTPRQPHAGY